MCEGFWLTSAFVAFEPVTKEICEQICLQMQWVWLCLHHQETRQNPDHQRVEDERPIKLRLCQHHAVEECRFNFPKLPHQGRVQGRISQRKMK